jgi:hypothetical protein
LLPRRLNRVVDLVPARWAAEHPSRHRSVLLTIAALNVLPVWLVRWRSRGSGLALIFAVLLVLSIAAAAFHYQQIARFCADAELAGRSD